MEFRIIDKGLTDRTRLFWSFVAIATGREKAEVVAFNALSRN